MSTMYTILLVIKKHTHDGIDNFERFTSIGMPTYEAFLDRTFLKEFIVVTPASELSEMSTKLKQTFPNWPWRLISEDKLVDKSILDGWGRQQTAKLAVSVLVTTEHYLIVDDDTYLTRPFSYQDMFDSDSKLIWNRTYIDFPFFFLWSNQVLKFDFDVVQREEHHMAITPEIFVTSEVRSLVEWLVATYGAGKQWQRSIVEHKYTEYCIYWIWLIRNGKHKQLYSTLDIKEHKSVYGFETTSDIQDLSENIKNSFAPSNNRHFFSFVQSSISYPIEHIRDLIRAHCPVQTI